MCSDFICLQLTIFLRLTYHDINYYAMYLKSRYLGLGSTTISNLPTYNILLWNDVLKCWHVLDQSRKGKLMDALRKNIEENLCGKDINHTHFRKKKLCCNSKKIKAFWLLAQPKKKCISIEKVCKISKKKRNQTTDSLFVLGDQCQVWFECSRLFWLSFSLLFKLNIVISRMKIYYFKRHDMTEIFTVAMLI